MATKTFMTAIRLVFAACLVLSASQAFAKDNSCAECHTAREMASFGNVLGWEKSVYQEMNTLCPGISEIKKDTYFAESRIVKYDQWLLEMEHKTRRYPFYMKEDLAKQGVRYSDLVSGPVPASISAFTGDNLKVKKSVNELYVKYNKLMDNYMAEKIIGLALIGVMVLTLAVNLGLKNTLKD